MTYLKSSLSTFILLLIFFLGLTTNSYADDTTHKLVMQVSTDDIRVQKAALVNIVNLQKYYGMDNIEIELVAYGAGLRMLTPQSTLAARISSLTLQEVTFTACMNTMLTIKEKTGVMPQLIEGVGTVQAGVAQIIELQEQGYSYVKP